MESTFSRIKLHKFLSHDKNKDTYGPCHGKMSSSLHKMQIQIMLCFSSLIKDFPSYTKQYLMILFAESKSLGQTEQKLHMKLVKISQAVSERTC